MSKSQSQEWSNSGVGLFLDFERHRHRGLRAGIETGVRDAIRSGRLAHGTLLPPTRALARDLRVSRRTVVEAYSQLAAEGWIEGRRGSGTVVAFAAGQERGADTIRERQPVRWRFDMRPGRPDPSSFPRAEWLRALRRALAVAPDDALGYSSPRGQLALRAELAGYLGRARGLRITPADLLITTGFTQGLGLIARCLAAAGARRIAIEEPSMPLHRAIVRAAGHELVLLTVDQDGVRVDELEHAREVAAVVLTPNRQHPTGAMLSARRRSRLLEWARDTGAFIVEDDYDGEFRYDGHPLGPLQGLEPGVVIYAGTTSKTLAPAVRLGWLAVPESLRRALTREKELSDWHTGALDQLAFTELLRGSGYDRHIRKMRLRYRSRRDAVIDAIGLSSPALQITGAAAGLNLLIRLADAATEGRALAAIRAAGVGVEGLIEGGYYERDGLAGVVIGYAAASEHTFHGAIEALAGALSTVVPHGTVDAIGGPATRSR
jgi:GntR family transcriptional regulator / MocR family aminotransferase